MREIPTQATSHLHTLVMRSVCFVLAVFTVMTILKLGYVPRDDAGRHAAKAVSTLEWNNILVMAQPQTIDVQWGWERLLKLFQHATNADVLTLIQLSVIGLFLTYIVTGSMFFRRPEAWLGAFCLASIVSSEYDRFMFGRPFVITLTALTVILLTYANNRDSSPKLKHYAILTLAIGTATLLHGLWPFWIIPVAAFALARQWEWFKAIAVAWMLGTIGAACITGQPIDFIVQPIQMSWTAFHAYHYTLAKETELQPFTHLIGYPLSLIALILLNRCYFKTKDTIVNNPILWVCILCWCGGYAAYRFWVDWGLPAWIVLIALELQVTLEQPEFKRLPALLSAGLLSGLFFVSYTSDLEMRWSRNSSVPYPKIQTELSNGWEPGAGGIIYSADMMFFYYTIQKFPNANWKYITGYEPALMPKDDFHTYEEIVMNKHLITTYLPWIQKMRPIDRLVIMSHTKPELSQLEWKECPGYWIGRTPR